jgi:predicted kinase
MRRQGGDGSQWLVALCGLPGVGKSTVAGHVTEYLGAVRLRTDAVRTELFESPDYTEAETDAVYEELRGRAAEHLSSGESVALDATFADAEHRQDVRRLAAHHGAAFRLIEVVCEQSVAEQRIATRDGISDAGVDVYRRFRSEFDPVECEHAVVDNSGSKADTHRQIEELF